MVYGPGNATVILSSLASFKTRMLYLSGAGLPGLSWKKEHKTSVVVLILTILLFCIVVGCQLFVLAQVSLAASLLLCKVFTQVSHTQFFLSSSSVTWHWRNRHTTWCTGLMSVSCGFGFCQWVQRASLAVVGLLLMSFAPHRHRVHLALASTTRFPNPEMSRVNGGSGSDFHPCLQSAGTVIIIIIIRTHRST